MPTRQKDISHTHDTSANDARGQNASANILAADLLVVDNLIAIPSASDLARAPDSLRDRYAQLDSLIKKLFAKNKRDYSDKISINEQDFKELSVAVAGLPGKMEAGGSTADILTTVKHLRNVNVDFLGIAGRDDLNDNLIIQDLQRNGINIDPGATVGARSAMSFIFTHPDGKHITVTYPGNAAQKLNPEMITDARVAKSDTVLIPISLWSKFDNSVPETLLKKSLEQDKKIIVSIPRQARFEYSGAEDIYRHVIPNADIIVADEDELARWYKTGTDTQLAIESLQADMTQRDALRYAAGKPARSKPVTALIKHKDDSATVLVAASPVGVSPATRAARYEIAAPSVISGKKHTLGVDDAMYAGFIAALNGDTPPQKAAEFAMTVAQTKFLYDSARIPSPIGADKATKERWNGLKTNLSDTMTGFGSAIGYAITGISNPVDPTLPRTRGQKAFDLLLYPLIANLGVFALSMFATYHGNFNQNKENLFVKRSTWTKEQLTKIPMLGQNSKMVRNLNMVFWSFADGLFMMPVISFFESQRQKISRWLDDRFGTTPEDKSVYDKEAQRNWKDVFKARITTFAVVIATYFALNTKLFPNGTYKGILAETSPNSGVFKREDVESINGFVFEIPAKIIGGLLEKVNSIRDFAQRISSRQLKKMAEKTGSAARVVTAQDKDARYQIEGLVNTGLFEFVYTSLCTAGLFFLGKTFGEKRRNTQEALDKKVAEANSRASDALRDEDAYNEVSTPKSFTRTEKTLSGSRPKKMTSYVDAIDKSNLAVGHNIGS